MGCRLRNHNFQMQGWLSLLAGVTILPYAIYQEHLQKHTSTQKLLLSLALAGCIATAPALMHRASSRKLLNAITYDLPSQTFELRTFNFETIRVKPEALKVKYAQGDNQVREIMV